MLKFYKMIFVAELIIRHLILSTFEVFIVLLSAFIKQNQINIILVSIHKIKKFISLKAHQVLLSLLSQKTHYQHRNQAGPLVLALQSVYVYHQELTLLSL